MRLGGMPALRMLAQNRDLTKCRELARRSGAIFLRTRCLCFEYPPTHTSIVRVVPSRVRCLRVCPTRGLVCLRAADPTCMHVSFYPCGSLFGMLFFVFTPFAI